MKIKACNVLTGISSVIGNSTAFYTKWLESRFPPNFFKAKYISDTSTALSMQFKDIIKKPRPTLIIKPEYAGENGYMELLPYWNNTHQYTFNEPYNYYNGIFGDTNNDVYIYGIPDRIKITFNTKILLPSKIYGINVLHYMKNILEPGGYFFINNVFFENSVPKVFIDAIILKLEEIYKRKLDITKPEDRKILEDYLQQNSYNGMIERRNLSTGNMDYAFNCKTNILMSMEDIPQLDVTKRNKVEDVAIVSFTCTFEFTTNSNFLFEIKNMPQPDTIPEDEDYFDPKDNSYNFVMTLPVDLIPEQDGDFQLRYKRKFVCETNMTYDTLEFGMLLDERTNIMISNNIYDGNKLKDNICKIVLFKDEKRLPTTEYDIDWKNKTIFIHRPSDNVNYTFGMYINQTLFNEYSNNKELLKETKLPEIKNK